MKNPFATAVWFYLGIVTVFYGMHFVPWKAFD